jgi:catechol 2,3-dioxygenase-like lactoylglutathione lyase family enzyme
MSMSDATGDRPAPEAGATPRDTHAPRSPGPFRPGVPAVEMKLEVVVVPVSDVDRAKAFFTRLGWRIDADVAQGDDVRLVQLTPPGSGCSVAFGAGLTSEPSGAPVTLELVVADIDAARDAVLAAGADRVDVFHGAPWARVPGPDPERRSYRTYGAFRDPDGNEWLLQEVAEGGPGLSTGRR